MTTLTASEIKALVRLLDEEEKNAELIQRHLFRAGSVALPYLKEAMRSDNPVVKERASRLVQRLQYAELEDQVRQFASLADWEMDIETGAWLVARYGYPDLDPSPYTKELDRIANDIGALLDDEMYMIDVVDHINHILFEVEGFRPDNRRFYDPENSYINRVIERRMGIPITLSLVYLLIAKRLELPIYGAAVPGHFLVRFDGPYETLWIDPFNQGAVLDRNDCADLLKAMGRSVEERYLAACTPRQIVIRMFNNLTQAFHREGDPIRADDTRRLAEIMAGHRPEQSAP